MAEALVRVAAASRHDQNITAGGECDRKVERSAAVRFDENLGPAGRVRTLGDRRPEVMWVLGKRALVGDDDDVCIRGGRVSERESLACIPVAGRSGGEGETPARCQGAEGRQQLLLARGVVHVVHEGEEILSGIDPFETAGNAAQSLEARRRDQHIGTAGGEGCESGQRVAHLVRSEQ